MVKLMIMGLVTAIASILFATLHFQHHEAHDDLNRFDCHDGKCDFSSAKAFPWIFVVFMVTSAFSYWQWLSLDTKKLFIQGVPYNAIPDKNWILGLIVFMAVSFLITFGRGYVTFLFSGNWTWGLTPTNYKMKHDWLLLLHSTPILGFGLLLIGGCLSLWFNARSYHKLFGKAALYSAAFGFCLGLLQIPADNGAPVDPVNKLIFLMGVPVCVMCLYAVYWSARKQYFTFHMNIIYFPVCVAYATSWHRNNASLFLLFTGESECLHKLIQNALYSGFMFWAHVSGIVMIYVNACLRYERSKANFFLWNFFAYYFVFCIGSNLFQYWYIIMEPLRVCKVYDIIQSPEFWGQITPQN